MDLLARLELHETFYTKTSECETTCESHESFTSERHALRLVMLVEDGDVDVRSKVASVQVGNEVVVHVPCVNVVIELVTRESRPLMLGTDQLEELHVHSLSNSHEIIRKLQQEFVTL